MIVSNKDRETLLVKRAKDPFRGMWCFPIGFAETGESIEDAALRELKEEAGIEGRITQLVDVDSHRNPFYGELSSSPSKRKRLGAPPRPGTMPQNADISLS